MAGLYARPIRRPYIVGTTPQQRLERVREQVLHGLADRAACRRRTASLVAHTVIGAWEAHLVRDLAHAHEACGERLVRAHDSDSTGWMLFRVRGDSQAEYVAVRRETGEVRFLGLLGVEARGARTLPAHSKAANANSRIAAQC